MPSSTLVAAAEAAPPLRRRRRRRQRRPFESVTLHLPLPVFSSLVLPPTRDWAAGLPPELLSCIFHRLDHVDIMLGADKVCRSWRRAARDEPELWRRIDMRGYKALSDRRNLVDLNQMAVEAVRRSQGQCQAFFGESDGLHDEFIHYLGDHAPLLKCLILVLCGKLSDQGFIHAINGFPLLEELHLSMCWDVQCASVLEVVANKCPRLKHLTVCHAYSHTYGYDYIDKEAMAIAGMHELRSLQLTHNDLTGQGIAAILDNCIHLKSLDILNCYNIHMTPEMEAKIRTNKLLMNYSSDRARRCDNSFDEPGSPSECSTCFNYFEPYGSRKRYYPHNYFGLNYEQRLDPTDEKEAMVISAVRELRSLELYRNDLTSKGLAAVLDKCPHLEPLDVWNCFNIVGHNNNALRAMFHRLKTNKNLTTVRATPEFLLIKAKKLTTKLLMDRSNHNIFNPEGLDIHSCRNMVMNTCDGRLHMDSAWGAKYKRLKLRKWAKKYHRRTKEMKASIEQYLSNLPGCNVDYMEFEGVQLYRRWGCWNFDVEFEPGSPTSECSTCLTFEYLAGRWGVLDLDDYSDYYDSSYGLDVYDEIEFQVQDRMLGKMFRRYLKME